MRAAEMIEPSGGIDKSLSEMKLLERVKTRKESLYKK